MLGVPADTPIEVIATGALIRCQELLGGIGTRYLGAHWRHINVGVGFPLTELEQLGGALGKNELLRVEGDGCIAGLGEAAFKVGCVMFMSAGKDYILGGGGDAPKEERPKGITEVAKPIRVQKRISGRVEVAKDDTRIEDVAGYYTLGTECLDTVDGVQWHPAQDEEEYNNRQVLSGFDLLPASLR